MNKIVYKPFKRKSSSWEIKPDKIIKNEQGRKSVPVKIGVQQVVMDNGEIISTTPVYEYIYDDILRKILGDSEEYAVRVNLGCDMQLVITYENRLVVHNDRMQEEIEKVHELAKAYGYEEISAELVNSQLNFMTLAPLSKEYKKLIEEINEKSEKFYPPDFIGLVLREYFYEQARNLSDEREDMHFLSAKELKEELGEAIKGRDAKKIEDIKEEIMYAFLIGDLVSNPRIKF